MPPSSSARGTLVAAALAFAVLVAGCGATPSGAVVTPAAGLAEQLPAAAPTSAGPTTRDGSGVVWHAIGPTIDGAPALFVAHPDRVTWLLRMDPRRLRFRFVPGYKVPEHGPLRRIDTQPATWMPWLLAAFNGAFKLSDHAGGYFYDGRTVVPLRAGLASLVVGTDRTLRVVVWRAGESTSGLLAVRQNLRPLVLHGRSTVSRRDRLLTWGRPLGGRLHTNRSALAVLGDGSLVYVYVHDADPAQLAQAALRIGAVTAMALDMNSGWPGALLYRHTGPQVVARLLSPDMRQHLDGYSHQNQKDFIAVLDPALP